MHPKSRDRKGNAKLLAKVAKGRADIPGETPSGAQRPRRSKYGDRLRTARSARSGRDPP